jgi:hypothetical protein
LVGLLQLTVAALVCGARSLYAIAQWGQERLEDDPALLVALGLPPGRRPCVATLHRVFRALDVAAFEAAVGAWLAPTGVAPDDPLALDGKTLRGIPASRSPGSIWWRRPPTKPARCSGDCGVLAKGTNSRPPPSCGLRCPWRATS